MGMPQKAQEKSCARPHTVECPEQNQALDRVCRIMNQLFKIPLLIISLMILACSKSASDRYSENFTDTVQVRGLSLYLNEYPKIRVDTPEKAFVLIRQKNDSTLKLSYFFGGSVNYFIFNTRDDSLQLIDQKTEYDHDEPEGNVYKLVSTYEDKEDKAVKLYKYEKINPSMDGAYAIVFSKKYGMIALVNQSWGYALELTYWDDKPIPASYSKLFRSNIISI